MRTNTREAFRRATNTVSRCTIRECDDNHLMQEIKQADVHHSETPTDFERFQPLGITAVPKKQDQRQQQQQQQGQQQGGNGGGEEWNNDQPKEPSAEGMMLYPNGQRDHPVCIGIDDRRVRPYDMQEGEGAHYAPDGSGQMVLHKANGVYMLSCDDQDEQQGGGTTPTAGNGQQEKQKRMVSIRHVEKKKQDRKPQKRQPGQQVREEDRYKHEGETVNTEFRVNKSRMEFRVGDGVNGYYDKEAKRWGFHLEGDNKKAYEGTKEWTLLRFGEDAVWIDKDGIWSSKPIQQKSPPDPPE